MPRVAIFSVADVIATPGAWQPSGERNAKSQRDHPVRLVAVGFAVRIGNVIARAGNNGIESQRQAALFFRGAPVILLITVKIQTHPSNGLANAGLNAVAFIVTKLQIVFVSVKFLVGVGKAVIPAAGVSVAAEAEVGIGRIQFTGIKQTP